MCYQTGFFSRLTSGIVSPSELPDSPTQTVPPSPKPRKGIASTEYSKASPAMFPRTAGDGRPQPAPRSIQKASIFEDNVTKFKEESTPVQFSTTTSLSSLTIDDREEASAVRIYFAHFFERMDVSFAFFFLSEYCCANCASG